MNDHPSDLGTVLVVEDEPLLRMMACDMVEAAGFLVLDAANADHAIALIEQHSDIHIVFTDIDMPGAMCGLKLAAAIRDRWPPIHLILTSGKRSPDASELPPDSIFYRKPYPQDRVIATMQAMVG